MNRLNQFIEKWMALVTPTCMLVGILFPEMAKHGVPYVPYVFAFMTFTGALKSEFEDVIRVFHNPKPLLIMLGMIHVLITAIAFGTGQVLFGSNINIVTGMVLEFAVPTGIVHLMWVTIYEGNNPLSLSLVIVDTLLAPFLIPLTLHMLVGTKVELNPLSMMQELLLMVALPAIFAMCLNKITKGKTKKEWPKKLAPYSKLALIFVVTSNASKVAPYVRRMTWQRVAVAVTILILAASGYLIALFASRRIHADRETTISMLYGTGMRNISAGAVIASACFPGEVMFPVMIGTLFQQMLAAFYGKFLVSRLKDK